MSTKRPPKVQKFLDKIKKQGEYHEGVPGYWNDPDYGKEKALLKYIEDLEKELLSMKAGVKKLNSPDVKIRRDNITFEWTKSVIHKSMTETWDQDVMDQLKSAMEDRFPWHKITVQNIFNDAADAADDEPSVDFENNWSNVKRLLKKLPWDISVSRR